MIQAILSQLVSAERGFRKAWRDATWRAESSRSFLENVSPAPVYAAAYGRSRGDLRVEKQMKSSPRERVGGGEHAQGTECTWTLKSGSDNTTEL